MKKSIYVCIAAISLVLCGLAGIACAQGSQGDTSISYDDQTGMITAYSETTNDLDSDYGTQTSLVVLNQNGSVVASGNSSPMDYFVSYTPVYGDARLRIYSHS